MTASGSRAEVSQARSANRGKLGMTAIERSGDAQASMADHEVLP